MSAEEFSSLVAPWATGASESPGESLLGGAKASDLVFGVGTFVRLRLLEGLASPMPTNTTPVATAPPTISEMA